MTQEFTIHTARTHLSKLIDAALAGEDVVIVKNGRPAVRLAPVRQTPFRIGILEGKLGPGPDFFEPFDERDLAQ